MTKKQKYNLIIENIKKENSYKIIHSNYKNGKISLLGEPSGNVIITNKPIDDFITDRIKYAKSVVKF